MARQSSRLFYTTLGAAFTVAGFVATQAAAEIRWPWDVKQTSCPATEPKVEHHDQNTNQTSTFLAEQYLRYEGFAAHDETSRTSTILVWRALDSSKESQDALQPLRQYNVLPMIVGQSQAFAMQQACRDQTPPRPMTHDLLDTLVNELSADLERVSIDKLQDGVFHGTAWLRTAHGREIAIDARPSDLLAWTARRNVPVFVHRSVESAASHPATHHILARLRTERRRCF